MRVYPIVLLLVGLSPSACGDPGGSLNETPNEPPNEPSVRETGARITVRTSGLDIDPDGYRVVVDYSDRGTISVNGVTAMSLDPGRQTIALAGLSPNCGIDGPGSRTVNVVSNEVVQIEFAVICIAASGVATSGVLAFTTVHFSAVPNNLALINVDGTNYRALTTPALGQSDGDAAWSPRGDRIAFSRMTDGSDFPLAIHVINPDGTDLVRLSPSGALDDGPAWSPDGQRIAFGNQDPLDYSAANTQIYLMNADGTNRVRLTTLPEGAYDPTWSPDGGKIAFVAGLSTGYNSKVYVIDADGTHLSSLANNPGAFDPAWSPDGSRIVFSRDGALVVMNADGTHQERLTSPPSERWSYRDFEPAWSPDGQTVVFTRSYDCDPFNDNDGPSCVPNELRVIQLAGVPFASSFVTQGVVADWRP